MHEQPIIIGIAGPSCSGKTTFSHYLSKILRPHQTTIISLDSYYHDLSHLKQKEIKEYNFDAPNAIDIELVLHHLTRLISEKTIEIPRYKFSSHSRLNKSIKTKPTPYIIVEGLYALYWEELKKLLDLKIFMNLDSSTCLDRRLKRDPRERQIDLHDVYKDYTVNVSPMLKCCVYPTAKNADLILQGRNSCDASLAMVQSFVLQRWYESYGSSLEKQRSPLMQLGTL